MQVPTKLAAFLGARFRNLSLLGSGQQGQVFRGEDTARDGEPVAIKWITGEIERHHAIQEFAHLATISHPGLVRVRSLEEGEGGICVVTDYIDGETLPLGWAEASLQERVKLLLELGGALGRALEHLHSQGVAHGDIKPANLVCPKTGDQPVVLLDLGLARSMGPGDCRGTPAYMAPETLGGYLDGRTDLYALGMTLIEIATGSPLLDPAGGDLVPLIVRGVESRARRALQDYPEAVVELLVSLVAVDRGKRPGGAGAFARHISRVAESCGIVIAPASTSRAGSHVSEFYGRKAELEALVELVCRWARSNEESFLIEVKGPDGSGRTRLVREALLRAQVVLARDASTQLRWQPLPRPERGDRETIGALLAEARGTNGSPMALVCEWGENPATDALLDENLPRGILLIVERAHDALVGDASVTLGPLSRDECEALCRNVSPRPVPPEWARAAGELVLFQPGPLIELTVAALALDPNFEQAPDALLADEGLRNALLGRVKRLSQGAGRLLELIAVNRRPIAWERIAELQECSLHDLAAPSRELMDSGLVTVSDGKLRCTSERQASTIDESLPLARRKALHRMCLRSAQELSFEERARHLLVTGPLAEAASACLVAISEAKESGHLGRALELCQTSAESMRGQHASEHAAVAADIALLTGDYEIAEGYANRARRSRDPRWRERGLRALARCASHRGSSEQATALLRELVESAPAKSSTRSELAKSLLAEGKLEEALREANNAATGATTTEERCSALEVSGLAHLYLGNMNDCDREFRALQRLAEESGDDRLLARALGLQGMARQRHSELDIAAQLYGRAAELSRNAGASHVGAVFLLNRGTVLQRLARYSEALTSYEQAHRGLLRGKTPFQLCAAHCNRGNLLLTLGEVSSARRQAEKAQELAQRAGEPRMALFVQVLLGEICEREHRYDRAFERFTAAMAIANEHGLADRVYAAIRLAEASARLGDRAALAMAEQLESAAEEHAGEILACRARVALALGTPAHDTAHAIETALATARSEGNLDLAWKLAALRVRTLAALGIQRESAAEEATRIFEVVLDRCPEEYRAGLRRHPDAQVLAALPPPLSQDPQTELPLRRLLALSRRLNSEHRVEALLDEIIDTAVELSRAERAFLLLRDREGKLQFRVARNMQREELQSKQELSLSIAERVAATGQVVMTVDAEADERFDASRSVAALQLRSILAVPFRVKERVVGTLYLDHRFRRSAFDDAAVDVVRELADIAAVAIENARLTRENQERQEEIQALNQRLEARLETAEVELAQTRAQVPDARPAGAFATIIGQSKPMRDMIAIAERAAACALSVVICGESGTGKELLARAIHRASARSEHAFVPINCGAVPDSLLEAELFGYKRGAFTGADRGKRGLFEVADAGTLFLDEIADTSISMQSKLLRALQEGEIRPLGAEDVRHVDIRVICASNKPLWDEVLAGRFREDLYYRLKVLEVVIPPLRERRDDIAEVAEHLLGKMHAGKRLDPGALRLLASYDWPGNVRELENEISRASAMSEADVILGSHLSEPIRQRAMPLDQEGSDDLTLKPRVEALERRLVEAAMEKTGNNQSRAAVLLGLSRYGLQKKLQRYGIVGSSS